MARARVGHGYLLTGPRGVGKTTAARILAMALNCPNRAASGDPCGECENCTRVWSGTANLDVVEIDAASNRGVDDARAADADAEHGPVGPGHHLRGQLVDQSLRRVAGAADPVQSLGILQRRRVVAIARIDRHQRFVHVDRLALAIELDQAAGEPV